MLDDGADRLPLVVDVTLRDGGYLNDWRFSDDQISAAITTARSFNADVIEIGYIDDHHGLPIASSWKPCDLERFAALCEPKQIAVMCRPNVHHAVEVLNNRKAYIDLVRIPVNLMEIPPANRLADICERFDIPFTFNMTNVSCYEISHLVKAHSQLSPCAECVYLADSRGALQPGDIPPMMDALMASRTTAFGFHAHNNLSFAKENSRLAVEFGCIMIDGSLCGIGLGGRNLDLIDALAIASDYRGDISIIPQRNMINEETLGVPAAGDELHVYELSGRCNLKMEWVMMIIEKLGLEEARKMVRILPRRSWLDHTELEPYWDPEIWSKLEW